VVVGVGLAGQGPSVVTPSPQPSALAVVPSVRVDASTRPRPADASTAGAPAANAVDGRLSMTLPHASVPAIRTRTIDIAGAVEGNGQLRVGIEAPDGHLIVVRTIPIEDGPFCVTFDLPDPRPGGPLVASVALIGMDGIPIEGVRRSFLSGPLVVPSLGEDGLVGGLVFGSS
jgi:hypothetical protein